MKRRTRPLRCKCCGKPLTPEPVKVCTLCDRPILRGHKWKLVDGRIQHRHCEWPDSYLTPKEYIAQHGKALFERMRPNGR